MVPVFILLCLLIAPFGWAAYQPVPRAAIDVGSLPSADALAPLHGVPVALRLSFDPADADARARLDSELAALGPAARLWIVTSVPSSETAIEPWRQALRQWLRAHARSVAVLELALGDQPVPVLSFAIRTAATELRASAPGGQLAVAPPEGAPIAAGLLTRDIAAYIDFVAAPTLAAAERLSRALPPDAGNIGALVTAVDAGDDAASAAAQAIVGSVGTRVASVAVRPRDATALATVIRTIATLHPVLGADVQEIDPAASGLVVAGPDGASVTGGTRKLLFDNASLSTLLFYDAPAGPSPLSIRVNVPVEGTPTVTDLASGAVRPLHDAAREGAVVRVQIASTGHPLLVDFNAGASADSFASRAEVTATRQLTVEEIIARHREQQARQDADVRHYQARVRMQQHFRPTVTDPGYDVLTDNRLFVAGDDVEWEELSFSVNGSRFGANRPPFPMLQPEKVLSLPLALRMNDDYRYRLVGTDTVDGVHCYVVRFTPAVPGQSLYRGTVWIDSRTFARVKVDAVQTHLSAPVVSNQEIQTYAPVATADGQPVYLLTHLVGRQIVMIAGRNLLVERDVLVHDFTVNGPAFEGARTEARRGPHVMYRDTDHGLRYYVKQGDTRVVSDRPTMKAKAAAIGITIDPSYAFPLPIFGIDYLNFSFGNPDTQFAMLFGGVLAAINVQRPKLPHTPFDASVDFFGIAVPSSDRRYDVAGEHPSERVITWPITTGLNLGWQYTPFQKATLQYQFRFDAFHADTTTSDDFVVPSSTVTNGFGGAYEYRRGGYSFVANGAWYARGAWKAWGLPGGEGALAADHRSYSKYSANLSRDLYLSPLQKLHFNGAYFGGRALDRFSRYQFGLFDDTRIHGVPASGVRFDELSMARGTYTFDLLQLYRIDVFVEQAWGRDLTASRDWRPITGVGTALNVRAPFNTILRIDLGHARLPSEYRGIGSTVLQVLVLKPLGS